MVWPRHRVSLPYEVLYLWLPRGYNEETFAGLRSNCLAPQSLEAVGFFLGEGDRGLRGLLGWGTVKGL